MRLEDRMKKSRDMASRDPQYPHQMHKCDQEGCSICSKGVDFCVVCRCAVDTLLANCPGAEVTELDQKDIATGKVFPIEAHYPLMISRGQRRAA